MTQEPGYTFPNSVITRTYQGDRVYAVQFAGDANNLLYQLKNFMSFQKLMQSKMTRLSTDGTIITAWSIVSPITKIATDFVDIDVRRSVFVIGATGIPSCAITFIDLPAIVPPMKYPGEIHSGEVRGVDYFKTYYTTEVTDCPNCQEVSLEFLLTYSIPAEPRHFHNLSSIPQMGIGPGDDDPDNHSVYSLEPPSWAEILSKGSDGGGDYIIWKAYTEMGDVTFSKTGLAIPLLRAIINKADGTELCRQEQKFDVDCCEKSSELRNVEIWWEGVGICTPFIIYNDTHICKMPASVSTSDLITYSTPFYAAQPLYAIPSIKGGCLPLEWSVSGPIKLINTDPYGSGTYFQMEDGGCNAPVSITLRDRCGKDDTVVGTPCCEDAAALSISYTSLLMSCSQSQTFGSVGGCGPYSWSVIGGGGTVTQGGIYTAPATNANCVDNPTIQVTDCCGNTAQVQLAINCYSQIGNALSMVAFSLCSGCWCLDTGCDQGIAGCADYVRYLYNCDGTLTDTCETRPCGTGNAPCNGNTVGWHQVDCTTYFPTYGSDCATVQCGCGGASPCNCNVLNDVRDASMKMGGCCPLNPITGLPY